MARWTKGATDRYDALKRYLKPRQRRRFKQLCVEGRGGGWVHQSHVEQAFIKAANPRNTLAGLVNALCDRDGLPRNNDDA